MHRTWVRRRRWSLLSLALYLCAVTAEPSFAAPDGEMISRGLIQVGALTGMETESADGQRAFIVAEYLSGTYFDNDELSVATSKLRLLVCRDECDLFEPVISSVAITAGTIALEADDSSLGYINLTWLDGLRAFLGDYETSVWVPCNPQRQTVWRAEYEAHATSEPVTDQNGLSLAGVKGLVGPWVIPPGWDRAVAGVTLRTSLAETRLAWIRSMC